MSDVVLKPFKVIIQRIQTVEIGFSDVSEEVVLRKIKEAGGPEALAFDDDNMPSGKVLRDDTVILSVEEGLSKRFR